MSQNTMLWVGFHVLVAILLVLDLFVFNKKAHEITVREALKWTGFWVGLAAIFCCGIYYWGTPEMALEFATGYVIEESLSVDNLFVFLTIFSYFQVPAKYQHKVLFWGIIGALVLRATFILGGIVLIQQFHFIIYVFGAFLLFTGIRLAIQQEQQIQPEKNPVLKLLRRVIGVSKYYSEDKFFVRRMGYTFATPLFVVLVLIETTDLLFAVDSIPAVLAVSSNPFIIYTSNIFAILGLRTLYFALAGLVNIFHYLNLGMSVILMFIGVKMVLSDIYKIPIAVALGVIVGILVISIAASLLMPKKEEIEE
ncbi:MAG: TerC family protein [Ignavibacteriae bacterium]|nr:TerC family protein [Ignavibacteriota bacterium]